MWVNTRYATKKLQASVGTIVKSNFKSSRFSRSDLEHALLMSVEAIDAGASGISVFWMFQPCLSMVFMS